jgi:hypothetical protein
MTVAQVLKHDFSKGKLYLYGSNGNHRESINDYDGLQMDIGFKRDYDVNGNIIYFEDSKEYWFKKEFDS